MKIILALILFLNLSALAYKPDQISISDYEFRRYIRPQLKSITNEFQTLLFSLNPEIKSFKQAFSEFRKLNTVNQKIRSDCIPSSAACEDDFSQVEQLLKDVLENLDSSGAPPLADVDTKLVYQHSKEIIQQRAFQLLLRTQNMLFQRSLTGEFGADIGTFTDKINYLYDEFNTFIFKSSDPRFRNEFNAFWINFIRPVETFALHQNKRKFFVKRLTDLNIVWHMLNVRLTKRGYKPSKQVSTLLNIMHRRWNNILKVSLKPKG